MAIILYRYSHPTLSDKWIYVGQTRKGKRRDKEHRYRNEGFGLRFKRLFPGIPLPQPEVFSGPFLSKQDADWAEIEAMFQHHTWFGYDGGMNLTLPGSAPFGFQMKKNIGKALTIVALLLAPGGLIVAVAWALSRLKKYP